MRWFPKLACNCTEGSGDGDLHEVHVDQEDVDYLPDDDEAGLGVEDGEVPPLLMGVGGSADLLFGQRRDDFSPEPAQVLISLVALVSTFFNKLSTTA